MLTEPFGAAEPQPVRPNWAQLSLHGISGMYFKADVPVMLSVVCLPYRYQVLIWLKSVPPTETLNGVAASPLTANPCEAGMGGFALKSSHPAEPPSPEDTTTVIPCAAACSQSEL